MRSDTIKSGFEKAPHRSLLKATGAIRSSSDYKKPFIGICNSFNELIPGHAHLQELGRIAKEEVREAGGVPFNSIPSVSATASPWVISACDTPLPAVS